MSERAFVDTNVILYPFDPNAAHHVRSLALMEQTRGQDANLWISPQVFCEVYRYVTHPGAPKALDPGEVTSELEALLARPGLHILPVPPDVTTRIIQLLRERTVRGRQVFDAQIAATMLGNGVRRTYTFNKSDFLFNGLEPLEPP